MAVTKRILVCGDSFFYDQKENYPGLHWTQKMPSNIEVDNVAHPGSSNAMIQDQFIRYYDNHDAVVFGFTGPWRIEFDHSPLLDLENYHARYLTSNFPNRLSEQHRQLVKLYQTMASIDMEFSKCASVIVATLELARERCQVVYSLNAGKFLIKYLLGLRPGSRLLEEIIDQDLPLNLLEYFESPEYAEFREKSHREPLNHPSFHVHHDHIQERFARDVISRL